METSMIKTELVWHTDEGTMVGYQPWNVEGGNCVRVSDMSTVLSKDVLKGNFVSYSSTELKRCYVSICTYVQLDITGYI